MDHVKNSMNNRSVNTGVLKNFANFICFTCWTIEEIKFIFWINVHTPIEKQSNKDWNTPIHLENNGHV